MRSLGVEESVRHALFECECHRGIRDDFVAQIRRKEPLFGMSSDKQRTRVLLSDDTPEEFEIFFHRYLISLFASREDPLDSLAPGLGLRVIAVLLRVPSRRNPGSG